MFDDNSAVEDFHNASMASDGAADRAASSPSLQRAVLGPAVALVDGGEDDSPGNIRCAARHDGFECGGAEGHGGVHWNGALWWDASHCDGAEERAPVLSNAGEAAMGWAEDVKKLVIARDGLETASPMSAWVNLEKIIDAMALKAGLLVPSRVVG